MESQKFSSLDFNPNILKALDRMGYDTPTPVQAGCIPPMLEWKDVIARAPTGTGKTFAFGVPIIEHINIENENIQALILCPTRELCLQITEELRNLARFMTGVRVTAIYGGQSIINQVISLKKHPQIIVATPGRLADHIGRGNIELYYVDTVVLDECDRMLDMGFVADVTKILDMMPERKNLALLSATISREVMDIAWIYQRDAVEITVPEDVDNKPDILQYSIEATGSAKLDGMLKIMAAEQYERVLVFCNTKQMTERLAKTLSARGFSSDCIHGDIRQSLREKVMSLFRSGTLRILVATDVAARGLDIDDVDAVFNYDIPAENEYYIHRIGRTGRAKKHGVAYSFVSYMDLPRIKDIVRYTSAEIVPMKFDRDGKLIPTGEK